MANHLDRRHLGSSSKDDTAADGGRHRMKPWPELSRAMHKAIKADVRFSPARRRLRSG